MGGCRALEYQMPAAGQGDVSSDGKKGDCVPGDPMRTQMRASGIVHYDENMSVFPRCLKCIFDAFDCISVLIFLALGSTEAAENRPERQSAPLETASPGIWKHTLVQRAVGRIPMRHSAGLFIPFAGTALVYSRAMLIMRQRDLPAQNNSFWQK